MNDNPYPFTFRIVGSPFNRRYLVSDDQAWEAYRCCDVRARVEEESYLGAFSFGAAFREHLARRGTTAGFSGPTWARHVWWDVDRDPKAGGVERAIADTLKLMTTLEDRLGVPQEMLVPFISGGKGCHLGLPTALWRPAGGDAFHLVTREFATRVAAIAGIAIDAGIYDRVRAFRAPNSRHPKTGFHKRFVPPQQFGVLTYEDALELAAKPALFALPDLDHAEPLPLVAAEWESAAKAVSSRVAAFEERSRAVAEGTAVVHVNRLTLDLIRGEPVAVGDRHRLIYSAARNLAEAGASMHLVTELLREAALDTGLPPREVDRQLECGFHGAAANKT